MSRERARQRDSPFQRVAATSRCCVTIMKCFFFFFHLAVKPGYHHHHHHQPLPTRGRITCVNCTVSVDRFTTYFIIIIRSVLFFTRGGNKKRMIGFVAMSRENKKYVNYIMSPRCRVEIFTPFDTSAAKRYFSPTFPEEIFSFANDGIGLPRFSVLPCRYSRFFFHFLLLRPRSFTPDVYWILFYRHTFL